MKLKPYLSLDLEFNTLDPVHSQIMEIGAVFDDGVSPIDQLPTFRSYIYHHILENSELEALAVNLELIKEVSGFGKEKKEELNPMSVLDSFNDWIELMRKTYLTDENGKVGRIQVAGKNAAGADIPILKSNDNRFAIRQKNITEQFTHRTLDVGSLYLDMFGENVTLGKINELTGRNANVSHRALDDAFDVVYAIRHKMGMLK